MKYSYVTYLGDDGYLQGTLGLIASLHVVKSKYPLLIMINKQGGVSKKIIDYLQSINNVSVKLIEPIVANDNIARENENSNQPKWTNTFSKLKIFDFTDYDKLVFLDSDMLVVSNLDNLFERKNMSAVSADAEYPGNDYHELNSGLLVIVPKKGESERLLNLVPTTSDTPIGDQDILHSGFPFWRNTPDLHLGSEYNVFVNHVDYYRKHIWKKTNEKVIHFVGPQKPWQLSPVQSFLFILKKTIWWRPCTIKYFLVYRKLIRDNLKKYQDYGN
ncbi:glycosyltransferase [Limosilactobacillus ingluviei]|uniref:glycosyltransferase n=1 Tax=Limosilactobacillus ingluviei TaxID=148604 RepID=UPI00031356A7|nr:glycosyltransferase [Limosilactobacillus ingluviei]